MLIGRWVVVKENFKILFESKRLYDYSWWGRGENKAEDVNLGKLAIGTRVIINDVIKYFEINFENENKSRMRIESSRSHFSGRLFGWLRENVCQVCVCVSARARSFQYDFRIYINITNWWGYEEKKTIERRRRRLLKVYKANSWLCRVCCLKK